jgi:hypothetical protein
MTGAQAVEAGSLAMERFVELPYLLHADDPGFVPPLRAEIQRLLGAGNPFFRYGEMQCFLASAGGRPAARCAAIINHRLRHTGEPVGLIGFFDSDGDWESARLVLQRAVEWLRHRGMRRIWGPMNFSIFHSYRLMTAGFDREPCYGEPRNPPSHPQLLERFGFRPLMHWRGWDLDVEDLSTRFGDERFSRAMDRRGFRLKEVSLERFEDELKVFHEVVTEGFRDNFGFSEMDFEEFLPLYAGLRHFTQPKLIPVVLDAQGLAVACSFILPDIAPVLRLARGDADRFAAALGAAHAMHRVVLHTIVLRPGSRGRGVMQGFGAHCTARIIDSGYRSVVAPVVKPGFSVWDRCGDPTRQYTLYELVP